MSVALGEGEMASRGERGGGWVNPEAAQMEHGGCGDRPYYGGRGG